jgi:hypothetical protein
MAYACDVRISLVLWQLYGIVVTSTEFWRLGLPPAYVMQQVLIDFTSRWRESHPLECYCNVNKEKITRCPGNIVV